MPIIHFIQSNGVMQSVDDVVVGQSAMQAAQNAGIVGIVAECGGSAMCATCHVYVAPEWVERLSAPLSTELEMLECTSAPRQENSRLSCQIKVDDSLSGLSLHVPAQQ